MSGGRYGHHYVRPIEDLVGKALVFPTEQQRHRSGSSEVEQLRAGRSWSREITLRGSPPRREAGDADTALQRLLDGVAIGDALDDVARVVGNSLETPRVVFDRTDEVEIPAAHVLHRANRRCDVDGILRLVQHHPYRGEDRVQSRIRILVPPVSGAGHVAG